MADDDVTAVTASRVLRTTSPEGSPTSIFTLGGVLKYNWLICSRFPKRLFEEGRDDKKEAEGSGGAYLA